MTKKGSKPTSADDEFESTFAHFPYGHPCFRMAFLRKKWRIRNDNVKVVGQILADT
jgi:hypothetical protein